MSFDHDQHTAPNDSSLLVMQLRCGDRHLVVPRSVVAEVIAYNEPNNQPSHDAPKWLLGTIDYRGEALPLLALDQLIDRRSQRMPQHTRVCVFYSVSAQLTLPLYAVMCHGFPSLAELADSPDNANADQPAPPNPDRDNPFLAAAVMLGNTLCQVPNLDKIERSIADWQQSTAEV